jgi:divalent metal cation (Fe/Co/Zn/Cd) transporter
MAIGLIVYRETQSLLIGEAATAEVVSSIRDAIATTPGIDGVRELRTIHLGPDDLVVAAGVWVDPARTATEITRSISEAERRVQQTGPFNTVVAIEPRVRDLAEAEGEAAPRP